MNLDPAVGSEIRKARPCVVMSPAEMNDYLRTVIVAPMTTQSRPAPFRIAVTHNGKKGLILLDQLRAVVKVRLTKKLGALPARTLTYTLEVLQETFNECHPLEQRTRHIESKNGNSFCRKSCSRKRPGRSKC